MGLFGGKKDAVKITDYFSAEELQKLRDAAAVLICSQVPKVWEKG